MPIVSWPLGEAFDSQNNLTLKLSLFPVDSTLCGHCHDQTASILTLDTEDLSHFKKM